MTTYVAIPNGDIDQDSPITQPLMTALRDNPIAIAEKDASIPTGLRLGYWLLGTLTTTSGTSQTLSGLTLTNYRQLYIDIRAVSASSTTSSFSLAGTDIAAAFDGSSNDRWFGIVIVDLDAGTFASNVARVTSGGTSGSVAPRAGDLTITSASTSISFTSSGTFDAGSILVYGVR